MKLLPYEYITYETSLKADEVVERLYESIDPTRNYSSWLFSESSTKKYNGSIIDNRFEIRRNINYRNPILPVIIGGIKQDNASTLIQVRIRLSIYAILFMSFWCGFTGSVGLFVLLYNSLNNQLTPGFLIPLCMSLLGYLPTMGVFKLESDRSKKDLQKLFEAEIVK